MLIKKHFIPRPDARTSEGSRKFARTDIRDGAGEIPFLERLLGDVVSVVGAYETF